MADDKLPQGTAAEQIRIAALREAARICRAFAGAVLHEEGSSGDEPEHDAAMSCANLIEKAAARAEARHGKR